MPLSSLALIIWNTCCGEARIGSHVDVVFTWSRRSLAGLNPERGQPLAEDFPVLVRPRERYCATNNVSRNMSDRPENP